ncbi:MAG: PKD domain-containing protein [Crocinitomicaceae bacterium]|nr:PKD domain-containing protein [Crocinitomicaceae bacterium]
MKKIFTLLSFTSLAFMGISQNSSNPPCNGLQADFTTYLYEAAGGIHFTNASTVASGQTVTYNWNFGNGNNSVEKDPFMTFDEGSYMVKLTVTDQNGCSVSKEKEVVFSYGGN